MGTESSNKLDFKKLLLSSGIIIALNTPYVSGTANSSSKQTDPISHSKAKDFHEEAASSYSSFFHEDGTTNSATTQYYHSDDNEKISFTKEKISAISELINDLVGNNLVLDPSINEASFSYALKFLLHIPNNIKMPTYDIHPDGELSYVWMDDNGITSIAFSPAGKINYASYFPAEDKTHRGEFKISDLNFKNAANPEASESDIFLFTLLEKFS